jgi:hypothetical protein
MQTGIAWLDEGHKKRSLRHQLVAKERITFEDQIVMKWAYEQAKQKWPFETTARWVERTKRFIYNAVLCGSDMALQLSGTIRDPGLSWENPLECLTQREDIQRALTKFIHTHYRHLVFSNVAKPFLLQQTVTERLFPSIYPPNIPLAIWLN